MQVLDGRELQLFKSYFYTQKWNKTSYSTFKINAYSPQPRFGANNQLPDFLAQTVRNQPIFRALSYTDINLETCFRAIFMPPARDWVMQLNALPNLATSARVSVKDDAS